MNVRVLILENDQGIRDITPLARLERLRTLSLSNTPVSDISPLHNLHLLAVLDLTGSAVANLTPLIGMSGPIDLMMNGNMLQVSARLAELKIRKLTLRHFGSPLDIRTLANLPQLEELHIDAPLRLNLSPLRNLTMLSQLTILGGGVTFADQDTRTQLQDIAAISGLRNLKVLGLLRVQVSDLSFAASLSNLEELMLNFSPVRDIRSVSGMKALQKISLAYTPLVDTWIMHAWSCAVDN
jgi:internalin A